MRGASLVLPFKTAQHGAWVPCLIPPWAKRGIAGMKIMESAGQQGFGWEKEGKGLVNHPPPKKREEQDVIINHAEPPLTGFL